MSETENAPIESDAEPARSRTALPVIVGSLVVVIAAIIVAAVVVANNHDTKPGHLPDGTPLTKAETHGRELFSQICATCHRLKASNSTGSVGPNLDDVAPSAALVKQMVTNGGAGGGGQMPAGLYSGKDLDDVAAYVYRATHDSKSGGASGSSTAGSTPPASTPSTTTPSSSAVAGDAAAGKQVFATTCAACHGMSGHGGAGGPDLRTMPLAKTAAGVTQQVTNGGGGMPAFGSQLSKQQIADVAAYVSSTVSK